MFCATMKDVQIDEELTHLTTSSTEATRVCGKKLAAKIDGGDVVLLTGPLGAGKSVFARGIAEGLGATSWRGSPTFNLVHEYRTVPPLYHADLYRLAAADVEDIGLEEYAGPDSILVVEWPERALQYMFRLAINRTVTVTLSHGGEDRRFISVAVDNGRSLHRAQIVHGVG